MARPNRSGDTRERLISAGVQLFSEMGYHGTGLRDILTTAGAPKGSFYNFFPSKEAYAIEVLETYTDRLMALYASNRRANASPVAELVQTHLAIISFIDGSDRYVGCLIGDLAAEISSTSDEARSAINAMYGRWNDRLTDIIDRGQCAGEIRDDKTAEKLAEGFWNQWQGALLLSQLRRSTAPLRDALETAVEGLNLTKTTKRF